MYLEEFELVDKLKGLAFEFLCAVVAGLMVGNTAYFWRKKSDCTKAIMAALPAILTLYVFKYTLDF